MIRSRFRDFDWVLLGFVLLLSVISVLEIRSATAMTKFHGFQQKQIVFLAVGLVLHVRRSRWWTTTGCSTSPTGPTGSASSRWSRCAWSGRRCSARGAGSTSAAAFTFSPPSGSSSCSSSPSARFFWEIVANGRELSWKDIGKAFAAGRRAAAHGAEAARSRHVAHLSAHPGLRAVSRRHPLAAGGHHRPCVLLLVAASASAPASC